MSRKQLKSLVERNPVKSLIVALLLVSLGVAYAHNTMRSATIRYLKVLTSITNTGTLTVGTDGSGKDVTFYSDTAGDNFLWDSSAEALTITGTNGQDALNVDDGNVDIDDNVDVNGVIVTDSLDVDGNANVDGTLGVTGVTTVGANIVSDTDATDDLGTSSVAFLRAYVDSVIAEHVRVNDLIQMNGDSSYIDGGAALFGTASFTTSDTLDTLANATFDASTILTITYQDTSFTAAIGVIKGYVCKTDTCFIMRRAGGTSGATYSYARGQ